ncbi:DUF7002 family protein [Bradyrhizobium uaiense]|uniref:Uncharacterized protein n=1 Tax=Bradyrhizobium uaiense TaxID=2594946 RepID=A0A6P1BJ56_9BRAD|nr:hypothetical protein [Bradyrhizobium uaiense]NEU98303.1 hypothetical protein [Bradyrhizobium uaiense]
MPEIAWHLADAVNFDCIVREGLKCAADLLDRDVAACETHRPTAVMTRHGSYIRDQAPMPPTALARCLDRPLMPADWYRLLNGFVFFWLDPERVRRHLVATSGRPQRLMSIDTAGLVAHYGDALGVTPFNTGNARRRPARRGRRSIVPVQRWQTEAWRSECEPGGRPRAPSHRPVELVASVSIPDIMNFCTAVETINRGASRGG